MIAKSTGYLLASVIALGLAQPAFATDQAKEAAPKVEKAEHARVHKGSEEIVKVQEALKAKGEEPGSIDGIMGKKTRAALKKFQEQNKLKATGTLDQQTAEKLGVQMAQVSSNNNSNNKMKEENK
ncbi:MAG: peptidoglycan-binding domain-containing protein [Alphaproteobacteria bacterium]